MTTYMVDIACEGEKPSSCLTDDYPTIGRARIAAEAWVAMAIEEQNEAWSEDRHPEPWAFFTCYRIVPVDDVD